MMSQKLRVTVWGENVHEHENPLVAKIYPDGMHRTIADAIAEEGNCEVRTATFEGKLRRRGRFSGYRSDWKKAYVKLKAGEKVPDFAEI